MTRANAYLVTDPDRAEYPRGELIRVLHEMKQTFPLRFRRQRRAWWTSRPKRRRAAPRAPMLSCGSRPPCCESCRKTPKGNPLEIARIAGIAAAKRTSELIPAVPSADADRTPTWR